MKIALIGYGKMGKAIEKLAIEAGHTICGKYKSTPEDLGALALADVAIEFSVPEKAVTNIKQCFEAGIPVVVGTTGWYHNFEEVKKECLEKNLGFFYATNFSLGVNLFFELNKKLASLMNPHEMYDVYMQEIHHLQKKDAPSGTAITLAEGIIEHLDRKKTWVNRDTGTKHQAEAFHLNIESIREDEVPGTHSITYKSEVDEITITHQAYNRLGFASGALKAAEWLYDKKGVYTMSDLLGLTK